jgi:hypothetical protein
MHTATVDRVTVRPSLAASLLALALSAGALAGCTTPQPDPTPTSPFSTEEEAFAAAEDTYRAYIDALNQVDLSDPRTFEDVYAWTTGELNSTDRRNFSEWHAAEVMISGNATVDAATATRYSFPPLEILLDVCYNVSSVKVVTANGDSLVRPDRPEVQALEIRLVPSAHSTTKLAIESIGASTVSTTCS